MNSFARANLFMVHKKLSQPERSQAFSAMRVWLQPLPPRAVWGAGGMGAGERREEMP